MLLKSMRLGISSMDDLAELKPDSIKRKRISSYDKNGGNRDWRDINQGETTEIANVKGSGIIKHIWCTIACNERYYLRNIIIRMYWDDELNDKPSVETPIGDFFGLGHAKHKNFVSLPFQMSPQSGRGLNCWWPMPFSKGFKITIENNTIKPIRFFYYIDYEDYEDGFQFEGKFGRFHAQWRRENPTSPKRINPKTNRKYTPRKAIKFSYGGQNTDPLKENYIILKASGKGHYVGCHLDIDNITFMPLFFNWPGEGDDMVFLDEDLEKGIATLHGTGTEDYVNQAWGPHQKYHAPYHGTILPGGFNWWGKISYYRYHIEDPIYFNQKIIVSIEHGHDNHRKDDWSSTAYWYQKEPHDHSLYPKLLDKAGRMPRKHIGHIIRKGLCIISLLSLMVACIFLLLP